MNEIKLLYFEGCPNAVRVKEMLLQMGHAFQEIRQDRLSENDPLRKFSSPTILKDHEIIYGTSARSEGACSLELPTFVDLKRRLNVDMAKKKGGFLTSTGSLGSILTVILCPVCKPALAVFLSSIGLGFFVHESVLKSILVGFLVVMMAGLAWSYFKIHNNPWPLFVGIALGLGLYLGRYVYFGYRENQALTYGSIIGLVIVSIWNLILKRSPSCSSCAGKRALELNNRYNCGPLFFAEWICRIIDDDDSSGRYDLRLMRKCD